MTYKEGGKETIEHTYTIDASVCFDAFFVPEGDSVEKLKNEPDAVQFLNEGYRHCKALAFDKSAEDLIKSTYIKKNKNDKGLILASESDFVNDFIIAMKGHRVWDQEENRKVPV